MKTREELKTEYEDKLVELDAQLTKAQLLPLPPDSFCGARWKAPYVTYRAKDLKEKYCFEKRTYSLTEALEIVKVFAPSIQDCQAMKSGCVSISPAEIQDTHYQNGGHLYDTIVMLKLGGGAGFTNTEINFYAKCHGQMFHVDIEIQRNHKWSPMLRTVNGHTREHLQREHIPYFCTPKSLGEDSRTQFATGSYTGPNYHLVYGWASLDNFYSWAEHEEEARNEQSL